MNKCQFNLLFLVVVLLSLVCGCEKPVQSSRFSAMRDWVIQGDYDRAIGALEAFVLELPASPDASRAGLFLFKANFAKGDFDAAREWCDWTIANHASSLEAKKCQFKIGLIHLVQDQPQQALNCFQVIAAATDNPLRPEATRLVEYLKANQSARNQSAKEERSIGGVDLR